MNEAAVIGNNALVLDTKEEENKLGRQVSLIEQKAESVVVNSDDGFAYAGELTKQVKQMQAKVTDYWEPMRKTTYEAYKSVTDHKKEMLDPLASAEKILKKKMGAYTLQKERERREREEELRRQAEAEMNRKLEEAVKAESEGDALGAEMAMTEAEVMESVATTAVILYSVENSYLDIEVEPQERERADMAVAMFYVLKDAVDRLSVDLAKLEGDCRVVDAIYAANDVRRQMAP